VEYTPRKVCGNAPDVLGPLAGSDVHGVAIAMQQHKLERYGHVFPYIHAFFCSIVEPFDRFQREAYVQQNRTLTLYLPTGAHLSQPHTNAIPGHKAYEEVAGLFNDGRQLRIERVPWVPFCWQRGEENVASVRCCRWVGRPPPALRGRIAMWSGFPGRQRIMHSLEPTERERFRRHARRLLVGPRSRHSRGGATPVVTWLLAAGGSNSRTIADEPSLVAAVQAWLARHRPQWRFRALRPEALSFREEAAALASSDVLVSLFGSALQNCVFMPLGAVVVEVHGALRNDMAAHWPYYNLCAVGYGHRWVGFAVDGSTPRMPGDTAAGCDERGCAAPPVKQRGWLWKRPDGSWAKGDGRLTSQWRAFVNVSDFTHFFARVVDAMRSDEWVRVVAHSPIRPSSSPGAKPRSLHLRLRRCLCSPSTPTRCAAAPTRAAETCSREGARREATSPIASGEPIGPLGPLSVAVGALRATLGVKGRCRACRHNICPPAAPHAIARGRALTSGAGRRRRGYVCTTTDSTVYYLFRYSPCRSQ
jgi:hypothetical protein